MNYCIVDISDLDNIVWDQVVENKETIRRSAKIAQPPSINIQGSFSL